MIKPGKLVQLELCILSRSLRAFDCAGPFRALLSRSAIVTAHSSARNVIGAPLLGTTSTLAVTGIQLGDGARLALDGILIGRGCRISVAPKAELSIGSGSYICDGSRVASSASITIGRDCAISWGVTILDADGHTIGDSPSLAPVEIGDHVWIGCNATILKGVTIGSGSIVAAGAVVTKSCPQNSLLAGSPARVKKSGVHWR